MAYRIGVEGSGETGLLAGFDDFGDDIIVARPDAIDESRDDAGMTVRIWGRESLTFTSPGHVDALADLTLGPAANGDGAVFHCACAACAGVIPETKTLVAIPGAGDGSDAPDYFLNADERGGTASNGKVSKTIAQAAVHLDRTYASWNDFYIQPGVADEDNRWDDPYWGGAPSIVTYAFRSTAPASMPDDTAGFTRFTELQINAAILALASWSDVANVVFQRVGSGTTGEGAYSNNATILFGNYATGADGAAAFAYLPSQNASGGDVWVKYSGSATNPQIGNYGQLTLVHEIGHAIGFSHPGAYNAGPDTTFDYPTSAEYYEDSHQYTVMSYFTEDNTGAYFGPSYPGTIMLDDIAAAQRTYGVNTTTRTGDTVYGFNSNADRPWFIATSSTTRLVFAVWDAGGNDTFDFSGYSNNQTIDLREGYFSSVGSYLGNPMVGNVAIAIGAVIENAIGGSGADLLHGNAADNHLSGGAGNDTLFGDAGADVFVFAPGGGDDTIMDFVVGTDLIDDTAFGGHLSVVQSGSDTLVTFVNGVTALLKGVSAATVTSASFLSSPPPPPPPPPPTYNLITGTASAETLNGTSGRDQIQGLDGDDVLNGAQADDLLQGGNGADTLDGGAGDDILTGGAGVDHFVASVGGGNDTITDFVVGTDLIDVTAFGAYQSIVQDGSDTLVTLASGVTMRLSGVTASTVTDASFIGLPAPPPPPPPPPSGGYDRTLTGTAANETIEGDSRNELIQGLGGHDVIYGNGGNDRLEGGDGNDRLYGGDGTDTLVGGAGTDQLTGGAGADVFVMAPGSAGNTITDFVQGEDLIDISAYGGYERIAQLVSGARIVFSDGAYLSLSGIQAADLTEADFITSGSPPPPPPPPPPPTYNLITGTASAETLNGTSGRDQIQGLDGDDVLNGAQADDLLQGGNGADTLDGGAGDDILTGGAGVDHFVASVGGGNDTITDFVVGTDLIDVTAFGAYQSIVQDGSDTLVTLASGVTMRLSGITASTVTDASFIGLPAPPPPPPPPPSGGYDRTLTGTAANETIEGDSRNELIQGLGGHDVIYGNGGNDRLEGGDGNDRLYGGDGTDTLVGGAGTDQLTGGAGADVFVMAPGSAGNTITDFVQGEDLIDISAYGGYERIAQLVSGARIVFSDGAYLSLSGIQAADLTEADFITSGSPPPPPPPPTYNLITGTASAETLNGTSGRDQIQGLDGDDVLNGAQADDLLQGGNGADTLDGGAGDDILTGGAGVDHFVASVGGGNDTITDFVVGTDLIDVTAFGAYQSIVQDGSDTLVTLASGVTMRLSGITASTVTDASFIGLPAPPPPPPPPPGGGEPQPPSGYNSILGTAAGETLVGGGGSDAMSGLDGADTLYGRAGNDWMSGGAGVDKLFGEAGDDVIYGGGDTDYLYGGAGADTFIYYQTSDSTSAARDYIRDFNAADGDILDVSLVDADINTAGDQAFVQVASFTGAAGQMTVSTVGSVNTLSFDTNGDSNADMVITVIGTLGSAWHL